MEKAQLNHLLSENFWTDQRPLIMGGETALPSTSDQRLKRHLIFKTSGSTGAPKGIALAKKAILHSAQLVNDHFAITQNDHWILALPPQHIGGFSVIARSYLSSSKISLFDQPWSPSRFYQELKAEKASLTSLVPTQIHDLIALALPAPESLRAVLVGGGHLPESLHQKAYQLGWLLYPTYGMTETASQVATAQSPDPNHSRLQILPTWETRIDSESRLSLKGPALFSGFLDLESHHYSPRADKWHETQDLTKIKGNSLIPLGRGDQKIKILGHLVNLYQLEEQLSQLAKTPIFLTSNEDERRGHHISAHFESSNPSHIESTLTKWNESQPKQHGITLPAIQYEALPRSPLGKILRHLLD